MVTKICACCGEPFVARPQVPKQAFCANPACQRERRQQWQRKKMLDDPFYRENRQDAQRAWRSRNPDYSRDYRAANPEYTQKNRERQRSRSQDGQALEKQTSDVPILPKEIPSGIYWIRHIQANENCRKDVWIVEITPVNAYCYCAGSDTKSFVTASSALFVGLGQD